MNSDARPENSNLSQFKTRTKPSGASWAHSVLDEKGGLVLVTSRLPDGREVFYYLLLSRPQRAELIEAMERGGQLDIAKYGRIAHSGWGKPNEYDREYMRSHYQAEA